MFRPQQFPYTSHMSKSSRFAFIDLLRALAAQVIVLHHLAFYGPLSDVARGVIPGTVDWLYEYGRLAVQIFFVTGGYCLAGALARRPPSNPRAFVTSLVDRYFRIGLPYLVALAIALLANEVARAYMQHPSISNPPSAGQLLAHVFFLHDVLGFEALTAGIWYLAIDLQLFAVIALLFVVLAMAWPGRGSILGRWVLVGLGMTSALVWNRNAAFEHYAIYFLGSYVFGMVAAWTRDGSLPKPVFWAYLAAILVALQVHFRSRLALSAVVAILLIATHGRSGLAKFCSHPILHRLAAITYSLFLIHFPICLVVNAAWSSYLPRTPSLSLLGMGVAWALSVVGAFLFHHHVELRLTRLRLAPETTRAAVSSLPVAQRQL